MAGVPAHCLLHGVGSLGPQKASWSCSKLPPTLQHSHIGALHLLVGYKHLLVLHSSHLQHLQRAVSDMQSLTSIDMSLAAEPDEA